MTKPALLFDIGNVLLTFDFEPTWNHYSSLTGKSVDEVRALIGPLKDQLESGSMPSEEFVQKARAAINYPGSDQEFTFQWGNIFKINAPMEEFIEQLEPGFDLFLFSNTSGLHKDFMYEHFPLFRHFKGGIFSHEAKSMKPRSRMYELAIEQLGVDPASTLYIDDLPENIAKGQELGFHVHRYDFQQHHEFESAFKGWSHGLTDALG